MVQFFFYIRNPWVNLDQITIFVFHFRYQKSAKIWFYHVYGVNIFRRRSSFLGEICFRRSIFLAGQPFWGVTFLGGSKYLAIESFRRSTFLLGQNFLDVNKLCWDHKYLGVQIDVGMGTPFNSQ